MAQLRVGYWPISLKKSGDRSQRLGDQLIKFGCGVGKPRASPYSSAPNRRVFKDVAGLTLKNGTNSLECIEANALDLSGFKQRDILFGQVNSASKLLRAHLALREHDIEIDDDGHRLC